jgi:DNA-binding transcriptional LysR family regulator
MKSLNLDDLHLFADVARYRSFRGAAAARGVSASTLSQGVRDLEARLGVRLLHRTTRSVAPTEAGARLLERLGPALRDIHAAVDQLQEDVSVAAGTLRINAPLPAIELVLVPMVGAFLQKHPRVRLEVVAETSLIDIVAEGFDAGIRWGEHLAQDVIAVPLGPAQRYVVVAAPALLAEHGSPSHPRDLLGMPCIRQRFTSGVVPAWEFEREGEALKIDPPARLVSTNIPLQRQAAIDGVGFWATFDDYVAADVAAGTLSTVLDEWCPSFPGPYLYYPGNRHVPPALRAFIDFARAWRK